MRKDPPRAHDQPLEAMSGNQDGELRTPCSAIVDEMAQVEERAGQLPIGYLLGDKQDFQNRERDGRGLRATTRLEESLTC
jgi:hypothetical protein